MADPVKVVVTEAAGHIAYSLLYSLASGEAYGKEQPVALALLGSSSELDALTGVAMELQDCAFELLRGVAVTHQEEVGFREADVAVLLDPRPTWEAVRHDHLLTANARRFRSYGHALDAYAKKTVKVLVVGDLANTDCLVAMISAPSLPPENFTCLARLDQNRAQAQLTHRLGTDPGVISNVVVWGKCSGAPIADTQLATISCGSCKIPLRHDQWLDRDLITAVQHREASVVRSRKLSSAASVTKAICDHLRAWWLGTKEGEWVSMGVTSDRNGYGVPEGLVYSFPVTVQNGHWQIVPDLSVSAFLRKQMEHSAEELLVERDTILGVLAKSHL
ncbi:malate dehydrogenase, cytoplasmic-like isoform X2 [Narcine bancroftii]|uniref:malate dehydrogenase, cytoplasmic-like isoform X2 n=1 Tax=Narcine bancroftii TaxID=1343680 RepID=UPI0038315937